MFYCNTPNFSLHPSRIALSQTLYIAVIRRREGTEGQERVEKGGRGARLGCLFSGPEFLVTPLPRPQVSTCPSLFQTCVYFPNMLQIMHMLQLLMRLAQYAGQALCNGPVSVRPSVSLSVCPVMDGSNCGRRVCL